MIKRIDTTDLSALRNLLNGKINSQDERSLAMDEIDLDRVSFRPFPRAGGKNPVTIDVGFLLAILQDPSVIPQLWKQTLHSAPHYYSGIVFSGTHFIRESGAFEKQLGIAILYLQRDEWHASIYWAGEDWPSDPHAIIE